jgi:hypothetical protein
MINHPIEFVATLINVSNVSVEPTLYSFKLHHFGERNIWVKALDKSLDEASRTGLDLVSLQGQFLIEKRAA